MNSKQRAYLRSIAMKINPIAIIGKGGVTDSVVDNIDVALESHELIKIKVLPNAEFKAADIMGELAIATKSTAVQTLGNIITLYRVSKKDNITHIELPR